MKKQAVENPKAVQAQLAPELHNSEQNDSAAQADAVARDAQLVTPATDRPADGKKPVASPGVFDGAETDLVDTMSEMRESGEIDEGAFAGSPDHDDKNGRY
ncbi:hypothetical protein [Pontixanthobacter sp.]|uniref:hypothetical protein n=1 Tax=Pontixanthobacter sp. TaxID=2792078 RepID=UPI003C7BFEAC